MALAPRVPVFVLTGFLGAGKTTLLNRMIAGRPDTAVIVNEFGLVSIDHDLVVEGREHAVVTSTGCICCTMGADLRSSLDALLQGRAQGRLPAFSRVIVETTGLADPAPIINSLIPGGLPARALRDHTVARAFALSGVITVLDVAGIGAALAAHPESLRQIAFADHLVLTHTGQTDMHDLEQQLRAINPGARIHDADRLNPQDLLQPASYSACGKHGDLAAWLRAENTPHDHALGDLNRHGAVRAVPLLGAPPLDPVAFQQFLDWLAQLPGILRIKGLVALADDPRRPLVVHGVGHRLYPGLRRDEWPSDDRQSRLIVIGTALDEADLRHRFAQLSAPGGA